MRRLHILGAAGTVTGSRFLYETDEARVLVDCGLFQGPRVVRERNWQPLRTRALDAVVLTHAHVDHSGFLPKLVAEGYPGAVYCSPATAELLGFLLRDAAYLQEEDARRISRREGVELAPLYTSEDAEEALRRLRPLKLHTPLEIAPGVTVELFEAGHILGACHVRLEHQHHKTLFSGDIGRYDALLLRDPEAVPDVDVLVMESTYGGRTHPSTSPNDDLAEVLERVFSRGGVALVPAFAVGRSQDLLYRMRLLQDEGRLGKVPIWLDSPMAVGVTELYPKHPEAFDDWVGKAEDFPRNLLPTTLQFSRTSNDSKALAGLQGPAIIVSAAGMCSGGRILHHLTQRLGDAANAVLLVGFMAEGTLGRRLADGETEVRIHGHWHEVRAEVCSIHALSAHADHPTLLRWVKALPGRPASIVLVHGEDSAREALAEDLRSRGHQVEVPAQGQILPLGSSLA